MNTASSPRAAEAAQPLDLAADTTPRLDLATAIAPQVYAHLREAIIRLTIRPGQALSENEIATRFGISRQPVREAFIKLVEAGLVRVLPQRGTFVMKISLRAVSDARFVREAVEVATAAACCRTASDEALAFARGLIVEQRRAAAAGDHATFLGLDERFHRALADAIDCRQAWQVVEAGRAQMDRVRFLSLPEASPMPLLIEQHEAILSAIEHRDPEAAAEAMRMHLREILLALPRLAGAFPDLFEAEPLPAHAEDLRREHETRVGHRPASVPAGLDATGTP